MRTASQMRLLSNLSSTCFPSAWRQILG